MKERTKAAAVEVTFRNPLPCPEAMELILCAGLINDLAELGLLAVWVAACKEPAFDTPDRRRVFEAIGTMFALHFTEAVGWKIQPGGKVSF